MGASTETIVEQCERMARTARNEARIDSIESRLAHLEMLLDPGPNVVEAPPVNLVAVHDVLRRKGMHLTDRTILDIVAAALSPVAGS